jgi:hypothetical protein
MSFLKISTRVFAGHVPLMLTGVVGKRCPLDGEVIVAAIFGGGAGTVPERLTELA